MTSSRAWPITNASQQAYYGRTLTLALPISSKLLDSGSMDVRYRSLTEVYRRDKRHNEHAGNGMLASERSRLLRLLQFWPDLVGWPNVRHPKRVWEVPTPWRHVHEERLSLNGRDKQRREWEWNSKADRGFENQGLELGGPRS